MMKFWITVIASLALAACGSEPDGGGDGDLPAVPTGPEVDIVAFGDSLFAGYNLPRNEAYPAQLEAALRARGINARVQNAAVSGDTTAAGLQRLSFVLDSRAQEPDLALIVLGGNDMLRGLPPAEARKNLDAIMGEFDRRGIEMVLMEMVALPNLGREYGSEFNDIYGDLADKYDTEMVDFFMEPLIFDRSLVMRDQIHPTSDGVAALVEHTIDTVEDAID